eukprot:15439334-Alexandrium_andersonii.AAC.1
MLRFSASAFRVSRFAFRHSGHLRVSGHVHRLPIEPSSESSRSNRVAPAFFEHANIASGVRTWNVAGPEMASKSVPKALE